MRIFCAIVFVASTVMIAGAQESTQPDLSKDPTLYVVGYAHLDTE